MLPEEQEPNPFTTPDLTFRFRYFGIRKMHFRYARGTLRPGGRAEGVTCGFIR